MVIHLWPLDGRSPIGHQGIVQGEGTMPLAVQIGLLLLAQAAAPADPAPSLTGPLVTRACRPNRDDITICGRRNDAESYRVPAPDGFDPSGTVDSVSRERHRLLDVGASGIGSCSTVGPGGWTGCMLNTWREADEQYAGRNHSTGRGVSVHVDAGNRTPPR
jgi:hypothetical protein